MYLCPVSVWQNSLRQCPCCLSRAVGGGTMSSIGIMLLNLWNLVLGLDLGLAMCVLLWLVKWHFLLNVLWHIWHTNGLSHNSFNGWLETLKLNCSNWPVIQFHLMDVLTSFLSQWSIESLLPVLFWIWSDWTLLEMSFGLGTHDRYRADEILFNQGISVSYESKSMSKSVLLSSILTKWTKPTVNLLIFLKIEQLLALKLCYSSSVLQAAASYAHEESMPALLHSAVKKDTPARDCGPEWISEAVSSSPFACTIGINAKNSTLMHVYWGLHVY